MHRVMEPTQATQFGEALAAFARCGQLFVRAQEEERIYFDNEVVSTGLQIISRLTARAATLNDAEQNALLVHWINDGPTLCQQIITNVERRSPPVMHPDDLTEKLVKP